MSLGPRGFGQNRSPRSAVDCSLTCVHVSYSLELGYSVSRITANVQMRIFKTMNRTKNYDSSYCVLGQ